MPAASVPRPVTTAFDESLVDQFNSTYNRTGSLWTQDRRRIRPRLAIQQLPDLPPPGASYIAFRQILGPTPLEASC